MKHTLFQDVESTGVMPTINLAYKYGAYIVHMVRIPAVNL